YTAQECPRSGTNDHSQNLCTPSQPLSSSYSGPRVISGWTRLPFRKRIYNTMEKCPRPGGNYHSQSWCARLKRLDEAGKEWTRPVRPALKLRMELTGHKE